MLFEWHKRFKEGRESVRDDERYGRSKEVNTPKLIGQCVRVRVTMLTQTPHLIACFGSEDVDPMLLGEETDPSSPPG